MYFYPMCLYDNDSCDVKKPCPKNGIRKGALPVGENVTVEATCSVCHTIVIDFEHARAGATESHYGHF